VIELPERIFDEHLQIAASLRTHRRLIDGTLRAIDRYHRPVTVNAAAM
jgi:hypothetical protein